MGGSNSSIPPNQSSSVPSSTQPDQLYPEDELDEEIPAAIRLLYANPELLEMHYGLGDSSITSWRDGIYYGLTGNKLWDLLARLGSDQYWTRIWIVQELVLAKRIIFVGPTNHCWCDETDLITCLDRLEQIRLEYADKRPDSMSTTLWNMLTETDFPLLSWASEVLSLRRKFKLGMPVGMVEALSLALNSDATDPRDSIYGVLGLYGDGQEPDYRLKMSEVYVEFFCRWLLQVGSLDILCFAGPGAHAFWPTDETDLVPTFVPNWRKIRESHRRSILGLFAPLCSASSEECELDESATQQTFSAYLLNNVLYTRGIEWDIVESPVNFPAPRYLDSFLTVFRQFANRKNTTRRHSWPAIREGTVPRLQALLLLVLELGGEDSLLEKGVDYALGVCLCLLINQRVKISSKRGVTTIKTARRRKPQKLKQGRLTLRRKRNIRKQKSKKEDPTITAWKQAISLLSRQLGIRSDHHFGRDFHVKLFGATVPVPELWEGMTGFTYISSIIEDGIPKQYMDNFIIALYKTFKNRSLFISRNGSVGLGQWFIEKGDKIVVFQGLQYPALLRKVDGHLIFHGVCYIPGLEPGKELNQVGSESLQNFKIH